MFHRLRVLLLSGVLLVSGTVLVGSAGSAAAAPAPPAGQVTQIVVWGDSMTQRWPVYLQELLGIPVINNGAGGETVQETKVRYDAWVGSHRSELRTTGHLCWCGHPNTNRQNDDADSVVPTLQAMAAMVPRGLFMPIGLTNGPDQPAGSDAYATIVQGVNTQMAAAFATRYAEVREYLVTQGLATAGLEPTPEDSANIAVDVPPASLRTDGPGNPAHLNDTGRHVTAIRLDSVVRAIGWVVTETRVVPTVSNAASTNPLPTGQLVRFTATVTAPTEGGVVPTGTVQFSAYDRLIGGPVPLVNGVAVSVAAKALIVGSHPVTAAYSGDATYAPASAIVVLTIVRSGAGATTAGAWTGPTL